MTPRTDRSIHHPEHREDDADGDQDQPDHPQDANPEYEAENQANHAENDHVHLRFAETDDFPGGAEVMRPRDRGRSCLW
jgi:hypothetical protein